MGLKMVMKAAVFIFLMAIVSTTVDAHFDARSILTRMLSNGDSSDTNYYVKSARAACCDNCTCTESIHPICQCSDIRPSCRRTCKACRCTKSIPPQCRCMDTATFCYDKCSSSVSSGDNA